MIKVDFVSAIAYFLIFTIALVLFLWLLYNYYSQKNRKKKGLGDKLLQCPYCSFVFRDLQKSDIKVCPQCKSYITQKEG